MFEVVSLKLCIFWELGCLLEGGIIVSPGFNFAGSCLVQLLSGLFVDSCLPLLLPPLPTAPIGLLSDFDII
jgi:hypothetical protein